MDAKGILKVNRRNNLIRAERALQAVVAYLRYDEATEHLNSAEELAIDIQDMIGDLAHLCVLKRIDFEKAIAAGRTHFASEVILDDIEEGFCAADGLERGNPLVDLPELVGATNSTKKART